MKTLDEVIAEMEGMGFIGTLADALHYLREYQDEKVRLARVIAQYQDGVKHCELAENKYRKLEDELNDLRREAIKYLGNPALTWEQLKLMVGKPVWVEIGDGTKLWVIIRKINDNGIVTGSDGFIGIADVYGMPTTWQAYRKERECE